MRLLHPLNSDVANIGILNAAGTVGASAPARLVGGVVSSAPAIGTYAVGDFVIASSGRIFVCTVAGTPGTWAASLILTAGNTFTYEQIAPAWDASGLAGATANPSRFVGGTLSGAPVSGTFLDGDFIIAGDGHLWICSVSGTPGTWIDASAGSAPALHLPTYAPADHSFLAWNYAPEMSVGGAVNVTAFLYGLRVPVPVDISVTNIWAYVGAAGVTLTSARNYAGLYTAAGVKIGQTADMSTSWNTGGVKTMPLTGGPFAVTGGTYVYVALLSTGTTPATFRGQGANAGHVNINQPASGLGGSCITQAAQTTIPTTFAPTATSGIVQWVALS